MLFVGFGFLGLLLFGFIKFFNLIENNLFAFVKNFTSTFSNIENHHIDDENFSISFNTKPLKATHGEKINIKLKQVETLTIVSIKSESLIKEFDCGQNRTNVERVYGEINRKFQSCAISKPKKNTTITRKILPIVFAIVLICACLALIFAWRTLVSEFDDDKDKCQVCDGSGYVPNEGFGFSKCPNCKGAGIPPL